MHHWFFAFWWLIFPIGFILIGIIHNWLAYLRRRDELALLKAYVDKGQEPPASVVETLNGRSDDYAATYGRWGGYGMRGRFLRFGPYWEWRRAIIFGAVSAGLFYAAWSDMAPHAVSALHIAGLITGAIALASLVGAIFMTVFRPQEPK